MWENFSKNRNHSIKGYTFKIYNETNNYFMFFRKDAELNKNILSKERNEICNIP